ncbi:endonuclease/exonuclease/phosphatase family protein, partial [Trifolium medium]|nr:endonuclease/exonuclease/phosphatase family protein [Trifolium medium]
MREKEEREGVERGGWERRHRHKGFVHRLANETTSYFFTNFPEGVKAIDLWSKFARFGRVGEVYIPNKLDKQGKRFGFVKFREVRDVKDLLSRLGDIWVGSFKLRVNLSRFGRGETRRDKQVEIPQNSKAVAEAQCQDGRSFKEALVEDT